RWLLEGIVSGISGYGNSVGVPTVGGEVVCDETYTENPLVNVLCLGVLPVDRLVLARASGEGNLAVLMGSSTGRDGIGGASMASEEFEDEETESAKRPAVQVGDPFEEKRLIEACLTLLDAGLAVGVQDLGAAGITGATSETAGKGGVGMDVFVDRVPRREPGMDPWEVMISESQERMLAIVTPDDLAEVIAVCERWEITATVIGTVTGSGRLRVLDGDEVVADMPAAALSDAAPRYERPLAPPPPARPAPAPPADPVAALLASLMDTRWVSSQYDSQLFLNTVAGPGSDAAMLRLKHPTTGVDTGRALALTTDGNHTWCAQDARTGTARVVCESVLNLACVGARPLALVNCLNFGNPEHPEVMRQLSDSIDGMSDACRAFGIPVVGGNVSLYNASRGQDIDPTPVVGLLGMVDTIERRPPGARLVDGHRVVLVGGAPRAELDLRAVSATADTVRALVLDGVVSGVHDVADGGLAKALAEMAASSGVGVRVDGVSITDAFDESAGRVLVSVPPGVDVDGIELGVAGGDRFAIDGVLDVPLADVIAAWRDTLPSAMQAAVTH
ncbi:MAG: phosphoribosylformylglycinamidine synthase subunit PurL, partial [Actinomycetota bacterium]|nr:phosphoribosylformylglycinamidine synthase subunit PurL [Actinomycetota bacterium]